MFQDRKSEVSIFNKEFVRAFIISIPFIVALVGSSCTQSSSSTSDQQAEKFQQSLESADSGPVEQVHPGKSVYEKYCLTCHQADGSGVPGMYPSVGPNEWTKDQAKIIQVVLNGQSGEIEVNGEVYNNLMPPHDFLSDKEVADVVSYVRANFGNELPPVTVEDVAAAR